MREAGDEMEGNSSGRSCLSMFSSSIVGGAYVKIECNGGRVRGTRASRSKSKSKLQVSKFLSVSVCPNPISSTVCASHDPVAIIPLAIPGVLRSV